MESFLNKLSGGLARLSPQEDPPRYAVAFSGGLDSTVLLTALSRLTPRPGLRALHIDHGLQPESPAWEAHCRAVAQSLGINYSSARVSIEPTPGQSLEAEARKARYGALEDLMEPGEVLLTAHHSDDQLETLLLRLFRGSGVKGLRGIAEVDRLGSVALIRPLLTMTRAEILAVGQAWDLTWLEDPSNFDARFDRNYLRAEVLPGILSRWPAANKIAARAGRQMAEAQGLLDDMARADAAAIEDPSRVPQSLLLALTPARRRNLLRYLVGELGLPMPDTRQLEALLRAIDVVRTDAQTQAQWPGGEGRVYRGMLYLFEPLPAGSGEDYAGRVGAEQAWAGPEGRLTLVAGDGPGLPDAWAQAGFTVRFRAGGERFKPVHGRHTRALKQWLQEAGVPPWLRARIPLLYRDQELVAVGDLWLADAAREAEGAGPHWQVRWTGHPPLA